MSVIKKEAHIIKPTQPTQHSPIVLSNNDLVQPKIYVLMHYFFKNVNNEKNFMDVHKLCASLEDILSDYYPLAGQLKMEPEGRMSIVCNDQGVTFIVAESPDIKIQDLEEKNWTNSSIPNDLLPFNQRPDSFDTPLFAAQHTTLADGSVVLGVAMHHSVADGNGFFTFLENWGLKARQKQFPPPIHDRTLLKASGNPSTQEHHEFLINEPIKIGSQANVPIFFLDKPSTLPPPMSKNIFYFSKDSLKKLCDDYSSKNSNDPWISTNDVLVAHLWRTVTRARGIPLDTKVTCLFASDARKRLNPPLPPNYFGNAILGINPEMLVSELINGTKSNIALNIRKKVEQVDDLRIRDTHDWIEQHSNKLIITSSLKVFCGKDFVITNWSKFPMYDLDFGYGNPIKCRLQNGTHLDGVSAIIKTPTNDGLEVYIGLITEHMKKLEQDPEFKMYL